MRKSSRGILGSHTWVHHAHRRLDARGEARAACGRLRLANHARPGPPFPKIISCVRVYILYEPHTEGRIIRVLRVPTTKTYSYIFYCTGLLLGFTPLPRGSRNSTAIRLQYCHCPQRCVIVPCFALLRSPHIVVPRLPCTSRCCAAAQTFGVKSKRR
jgi:hypothetical protein